MILTCLMNYYEALVNRGAIARPGWGKVRVQYALELDDNGGIRAVLPLESTDEKGKPVPFYCKLPAPVKRSGPKGKSNFLWDNVSYLLGIEGKGMPGHARECFESAKKLHLALLSGSNVPFAQAICRFFARWAPEQAAAAPWYAEYGEKLLVGGNLTFFYGGRRADQEPAFRPIWQAHYDAGDEADGVPMRCLVTGERVVPAAVHPSIKKVYGARSSGAALVSFNADAFCSYERKQNCNAPVSHYAAFAYTAALNALLADPTHFRRFGDVTVVYWAEDAAEQYANMFSGLLDGGNVTDNDLDAAMNALVHGRACNWDAFPLHPDNHFYVLGIAPNAARLSVCFFLQDRFGAFVSHFQEHYDRLRIVRPSFEQTENLPLWRLLGETVRKKKKPAKPTATAPKADAPSDEKDREKPTAPLLHLAADTLRAILLGGRYPTTLYQNVMLRIRAEHEVPYAKAAIIKAYLLKNGTNPKFKEVLTVELNEASVYQPYVLGRLFSVLEDLQSQANPGINTTIKDKYFTSACATPAVVFPTLLKLAEKHLRKLDAGQKVYYSKQIGELINRITESYPAHLTLSDQGIFQLGYYHQTQKRYTPKHTTNPNNLKEETDHV